MNYSPPRKQSIPATSLSLNLDEAIAHLRFIDPVGCHQLSAIHPTRPGDIRTETFGPIDQSQDDISTFISRYGTKYGIYYLPNEPRGDLGHQRASKSDIANIRAVWIDLDPDKDALKSVGLDAERKRLLKIVHEICTEPDHYPSSTVDSGGGMQAIWRLKSKRPAAEAQLQAENQGRGLASAYGGDSVSDINRLLRLPGTINFPSKTKQQAGRTAATLARAFGYEEAADTTLDELATFHPPISEPKSSSKSASYIDVHGDVLADIVELNDLPEDLLRRFTQLRAHDEAVNRLWSGDRSAASGNDDSGSGFAFSLAQLLRPTGLFTATEFGMLLRVWEHSSADKDKIDPRYVARAWAKARASAIEEFTAAEGVKPVAAEFPATPTTEACPSLLKSIPWTNARVNFDEQFLIDRLIPNKAMAVVYGASNAGKTYAVVDMAVAAATGREWNGFKVRPGLVVYVAAEGGNGFMKRVAAYRQERGAMDIPFQIVPSQINLLKSEDLKKLIATVKAAEILHGKPCAMIVLDTLARVMGSGDENSASDMGLFVRACDRLREDTGATVLVVHHTGKDKGKGARGSSALQAATDTEIEIAAIGAGRGVLEVTKQRDLDRIRKLRFDLKPVEIGRRPDGEPVTACVVDWILSAESEFEAKLTPPHQHAFDCLKKLIAEKETTGKRLAATFTEWKNACGPSRPGRKASDGSARGDKQALVRAAKDLVEQELVAKTEGGQYVIVGAA